MMDKRYLGVFMVLATQQGWIDELLPADGSTPDVTQTNAFKYGLDKDILQDFYNHFGSNDPLLNKPDLLKQLVDVAASDTFRDAHRGLFETLGTILQIANVGYAPPPCPSPSTVEYVVNAVNNAPANIADLALRIKEAQQ